jgi:hypothetical protein
MRRTTFLLALSAVVVLSGRPAAAQQYKTLGPNECLNCHDHQDERKWYEKQEIPEIQKRFPQKGANAGHINSSSGHGPWPEGLLSFGTFLKPLA